MKQALHTIVGTRAILWPRRRCVREYSRMLDASVNTSIWATSAQRLRWYLLVKTCETATDYFCCCLLIIRWGLCPLLKMAPTHLKHGRF